MTQRALCHVSVTDSGQVTSGQRAALLSEYVNRKEDRVLGANTEVPKAPKGTGPKDPLILRRGPTFMGLPLAWHPGGGKEERWKGSVSGEDC